MVSGKKRSAKRNSINMSNILLQIKNYYRSTCVGLKMGLINELPINANKANKISDSHI